MRNTVTRILAALAIVIAMTPVASAAEKLNELTVDQVAQKLKDKNVYVFDCNGRDEWASGHVPHAKWVDFTAVKADDLPKDKNATLIFYCQNEH